MRLNIEDSRRLVEIVGDITSWETRISKDLIQTSERNTRLWGARRRSNHPGLAWSGWQANTFALKRAHLC